MVGIFEKDTVVSVYIYGMPSSQKLPKLTIGEFTTSVTMVHYLALCQDGRLGRRVRVHVAAELEYVCVKLHANQLPKVISLA